jgi:UDP-glucose 4-epimerase/GDP-4-dehydro-6-deoxy-D-mannose reductase
MRILGTGLTGTIGRFMSKVVTPIGLDLSANKATFSNLDFRSDDTLIHLGGVVGSSLVEKNLAYSRNVNIRGTKFLAETFKNKSAGKFVYLSSSHVYAPSNNRINENDKVDPISIYGSQKLEAETILQETFSTEPNRLLIVRIFSILDWGGRSFTLSDGIHQLIKKNSSFNLFNVDDIRDFLTPKTVAQEVLAVSKSVNAFGIINLCSGEGTRVMDAAVRMLSESGFTVPWNNLKAGNSNVPVILGDPSRIEILINKKLSWLPGQYKST